MSGDGSNPLKWDCEKQGCFNLKKRPKIEQFHECFPGNINFGDVDGIVEINGKALMLEWKPSGQHSVKKGQQIMYERLTKAAPLSVVCVSGNPETMEIEGFWGYKDGECSEFKPASIDDLKRYIRHWVRRAYRGQCYG